MNIHFLHPAFLYALSAVIIPVIIHLFNFRRYKTVFFSNLQFLKDIRQETQSQSKLKHLLVLISRILVIVFLVLAFAQPYIPKNEGTPADKQTVVGIYADNSFSMDGESKYGKLTDVAKNKIREISNAYRPETRFLFSTNNFEPKHQHLINRDQLNEYSGEITTSPYSRTLSEVISRQSDLMQSVDNRSLNHTIFLISDFQKNITDINKLKDVPGITFNLLPLSTQTVNNLYIDSCWFETPARKFGQAEELFVRIINKSDESYQNIPVKLFLNDSVKAISSFSIAENSAEIVMMTYTNTIKGLINGRIEITDYPIVYDNTFYFNYSVANSINILSICRNIESNYLKALFEGDSYINYSSCLENNINYSSLTSFNTIVLYELNEISSGLSQELRTFVDKGGSLVIFPSETCNTTSFNTFLKSIGNISFGIPDTQKINVSFINYSDYIYKNTVLNPAEKLNLPVITYHYKIQIPLKSASSVLLSADNKDVILVSEKSGQGKVYISAVPVSEKFSNLARHPVFVPTIYNISLHSVVTGKLYYTLGAENEIDLPSIKSGGENIVHLKNIKSGFDLIPEQRILNGIMKIYPGYAVADAGNYLMSIKDSVLKGASFNYNRSESDPECYPDNILKDLIKNAGLKNYNVIDTNTPFLTKTLKELNEGTPLWKLFILLSLFFLAVEIALLRLWK